MGIIQLLLSWQGPCLHFCWDARAVPMFSTAFQRVQLCLPHAQCVTALPSAWSPGGGGSRILALQEEDSCEGVQDYFSVLCCYHTQKLD